MNEVSIVDTETIIGMVTVDCKDNQRHFMVKDRLDVIQSLLDNSEYRLLYDGKLCRIYGKKDLGDEPVVVISSHVDCVYGKLFCERHGNDSLKGTFDNSLTNGCVLSMMLNGQLDDNVVVAFTGDEEEDSLGADEVVRVLTRDRIRLVLALDVTEEGWDQNRSFTVENDFKIDARAMLETLELSCRDAFDYIHEGEPDETWEYDEFDIPCLSLCIPIKGDMHSDRGCLVRCASIPTYCTAISTLADNDLSESFCVLN